MDFITRFERALSHQRQKELLADHIDAFEMPQCTLLMPMNKQMATLYTRAMFQKWKKTTKSGLVSNANGNEIKDCADPGL
ncbi:unnamed protein product [Prunus brigantina]